MIVTYSPEGESPRVWEYDPNRVRVTEAEMIEKRFGESWDAFKMAVLQGSMRARRVLLWHLQKKEHPTLRYEDVDFAISELTVELTRPELEELRGAVVRARGLSTEDREQALAAIDAEIENAPEGLNEGKALSKN